jgi:deazaflavin-dependent oxidoreductase (nitroreductase family)
MTDRDWNAQNRMVVAEFRRSQGRVGGYFADKPLLLLTTTGAKSGKKRINPLGYLADGDRYVVFASLVGGPTNPDWYHNLVADPDVVVEVGTRTFEATAVVTKGEERDTLFKRQAALHPQWASYQTFTTREIPVIALIPKT